MSLGLRSLGRGVTNHAHWGLLEELLNNGAIDPVNVLDSTRRHDWFTECQDTADLKDAKSYWRDCPEGIHSLLLRCAVK